MAWLDHSKTHITLRVVCQPRAKKSEIIGIVQDRLKIRLMAMPIEGRANEALCEYLAKLLRLPKTKINVTQGETGRLKTITIDAGEQLDRCILLLQTFAEQGKEPPE